MEKKYQVFVSSTYEDLKEERAAVSQCLLDCGFIPVGMEQFPASGMSQMEYIKKMLSDCDYYILILAGRYGSVDEDGIGYTEKEYDYALSKNIPTMSFVIEDPGELKSNRCESTDEGRQKLDEFRKKVCSNKLVKMYTNKDNLTKAVATSLMNCIRDFPAIGWVRADQLTISDSIDDKIEEYIKNHTASKEDIEKMFANDNIILDGESVSNSTDDKQVTSNETTEENVISTEGVKTMIETFTKHIPKISFGKTPPEDMKNGDLFFQTAEDDQS